jgi:hypothetical protein
MPKNYDFDAAIMHNRVCEINLFHLSRSQLRRLSLEMQKQFRALMHLRLGFDGSHSCPAPVLPDGLLHGSTPRLQSLKLYAIPFPALQTFFCLRLTFSISPFGIFLIPGTFHPRRLSPVWPSWLTSNLLRYPLDFFQNGRADVGRPPPPTHIALLALTRFVFRGLPNTWSTVPRGPDRCPFAWLHLDDLLLSNHIRHPTTRPVHKAPQQARVEFDNHGVQVRYSRHRLLT